MTDATDTPAPGAWPPASALPGPKAPPAEWARFYRDRCGWIVLPTPGGADIDAVASKAFNDALLDYRADHGGEADEETRAALWALCRNDPDLRRLEKGAWWKVKAKDYPRPESVTDALIRQWWGDKRGRDRGIAVVPGEGRFPFVLIDVDQHGDDPDAWGDLDGPWGRGVDPASGMECLRGPRSITPGGGIHTLVRYTGAEVSSAGRTALAVGVEVKARGGAPVKVPAGSATPGRRWERWEEPQPGPDALRVARRPAARTGGPDDEGREREPGDDDEPFESGLAARVLLGDAGDGERNAGAAAIVGVLARPRACPDDVVRAALVLLTDDLAGPRERLAGTPQAREEAARWCHALTRGPRDADFAAEVVAKWIRVRDTGRPPWTEAKAERVARSMWKSAARRLAGSGEDAGAEDFGVGPMLTARPDAWPAMAAPPSSPPQPTSPAEPASTPADPDAVPYPPPLPGTAPAVQAPAWRGGIDPRTFIRSFEEFYGDEKLERDLKRKPVKIAGLVPVLDFATGLPSTAPDLLTPPILMGWGPALCESIGGLSHGDFRIIGAGAAGMGKTWFELWLAYGLALATAHRLLGVRGYEDAPVVLPIMLTELPKEGEFYFRAAASYLGADLACFSAGIGAAEAPGVRAMAAEQGMTPHEVVDKARALLRLHGGDERFPLCVARRHVLRMLNQQDLPRRGRVRSVFVDHRVGPDLIDHVADGIDLFRERLARDAGVSVDDVLPVVVIDPAQRFIGDNESEKRAIDALFNAIDTVLCRDLGCAVIGTSDTTKAAARESTDIATFLSKNAAALAADLFAGSQGIMHHADCLALCAEEAAPGVRKVKVHTRVLKSRATGAPAESYPFTWERSVGRYMPLPPEPLRPPPPREGDSSRGQYGRGAPTNASPIGARFPGLGHGALLPD